MRQAELQWRIYKTQFFDQRVVKSFRNAAYTIMSRFGAFVRRDVRRSLRRTGTRTQPASRPGQPPFSPTDTLRKWILFAWDDREQSVTVGPHKLNIVHFRGDGEPVRGTVPETLEEGGTIKILEALYRVPVGTRRGRNARGRFARETVVEDRWYRADLRSRRRLENKPLRMRTVRIAPRPYMRPAFGQNLPHLKRWKAAVT